MPDDDRYRGLRPNPDSLGVTPLDEGEESRPVRVRAPRWVHDRLRSMTAREIGELIQRTLTKERNDD